MDKNTIVASEAVAALDARMPFRFPREMVIVLIIVRGALGNRLLVGSPFRDSGMGADFQEPRSRCAYDFVLITLARVAAALLISFAARHRSAVAMYLWTPFESYFRPVVRLFMAVPVVCWILFSVLWFKWVEFRIAFVLIVVCAPVFIIDFLDGMKGVQHELRDMLRSFRPSRTQFFTKLLLPATCRSSSRAGRSTSASPSAW